MPEVHFVQYNLAGTQTACPIARMSIYSCSQSSTQKPFFFCVFQFMIAPLLTLTFVIKGRVKWKSASSSHSWKIFDWTTKAENFKCYQAMQI